VIRDIPMAFTVGTRHIASLQCIPCHQCITSVRHGETLAAEARLETNKKVMDKALSITPGYCGCSARYITLKVSYTVIWAPPCNTGQPLAIPTAALSESAAMMV
jgi:hypothetical protein